MQHHAFAQPLKTECDAEPSTVIAVQLVQDRPDALLGTHNRS